LSLSKSLNKNVFEIAGYVIQPGERIQFDLPTANLYTHAPLNMPIEVIHGKYSGPILLICAAIHGDRSQNQRQKALKDFKLGKLRVLVATDIAARGIDIDKLQFVINYDVPNESETYVHRIGRCGRAGENGIAFSICEPEENAYVRDIEKLTNQPIEVVKDHPFPQTEKPMSNAEKKEFEKEKQRRKQEFFQNRKKKQGGGNFGRRNRR